MRTGVVLTFLVVMSFSPYAAGFLGLLALTISTVSLGRELRTGVRIE